MKKTSVYLDEDHAWKLRTIASREGRSQAQILREAIDCYDEKKPDRDFALGRLTRDDLKPPAGTMKPVSQMTEEEMLEGFGEDSLSDYQRALPRRSHSNA
ncbi:MAG: ribbon-helix-helix protein, CopG family [Chloroflexota bacterium]